MKKLAVIVGAGRGMGNNIAERFAKENFKIVLIARNEKNLDEYVEEFRKKILRFTENPATFQILSR